MLALLGESLRFWGVAYAGSLTRVTGSVGAPEVVVAGPFSYVRNPLYIGNIMMYSGVGVMANALTPWLVLIALPYFVFQYSLIVSLEEEFLEKEFGAAYLEYKKNVPRFFPWLMRTSIHLRNSRSRAGRKRCVRNDGPSRQLFL